MLPLVERSRCIEPGGIGYFDTDPQCLADYDLYFFRSGGRFVGVVPQSVGRYFDHPLKFCSFLESWSSCLVVNMIMMIVHDQAQLFLRFSVLVTVLAIDFFPFCRASCSLAFYCQSRLFSWYAFCFLPFWFSWQLDWATPMITVLQPLGFLIHLLQKPSYAY